MCTDLSGGHCSVINEMLFLFVFHVAWEIVLFHLIRAALDTLNLRQQLILNTERYDVTVEKLLHTCPITSHMHCVVVSADIEKFIHQCIYAPRDCICAGSCF